MRLQKDRDAVRLDLPRLPSAVRRSDRVRHRIRESLLLPPYVHFDCVHTRYLRYHDALASQKQVGGNHENITFLGNGTVWKRVGKADRLASASAFYRAAHGGDPIFTFSPEFFGITGERRDTLILADVTRDFDPSTTSVMDIKVGTKTYTESVSVTSAPAYVRKMRDQYGVHRRSCSKKDYMTYRDRTSTTSTHGFRITAVRAAHGDEFYAVPVCANSGGVAWYDAVGRDEAISRSLRYFAHDGVVCHRDVLAFFADEVDRFADALEASAFFASREFVGTSLLFVFDHRRRGMRMKWIDFAHVYEPTRGKKNDGVLFGARSLARSLRRASRLK